MVFRFKRRCTEMIFPKSIVYYVVYCMKRSHENHFGYFPLYMKTIEMREQLRPYVRHFLQVRCSWVMFTGHIKRISTFNFKSYTVTPTNVTLYGHYIILYYYIFHVS